MKNFFFFLFLFSSFGFKSVESFGVEISYQILNSIKHSYELKELCEHFKQTHQLLVEAKSISEVDCMGKIFTAKDFCLQKWGESHHLLRGYIKSDEKKVVCQLGDQVVLKYPCKRGDSFCRSAESGCSQMKELFSYQLPLLHSSKTSDNTLNCIFEKEEDLTDLNWIKKSLL